MPAPLSQRGRTGQLGGTPAAADQRRVAPVS
jgi:hypothetical protein